MTTLTQAVKAGTMWECRKCGAVGLGAEPRVCGFCHPELFRPRFTRDPQPFGDRMAGAGLDFAAIGVQAPEGVALPPAPAPAPTVTAAVTVACIDYGAHQSAHHYTPAGWLCDLCALPW